MTSTIVEPLADSVKTLLETVTGLTVYRWNPADISPPCAVIEPPAFSRVDPEQDEDVPLGTIGWLITFPVTVYVDLDEAEYAQSQVVAFTEAVVSTIDGTRTLDHAGVLDAGVTGGEPVFIEDRNRTLVAYECQLAALLAVADPDL